MGGGALGGALRGAGRVTERLNWLLQCAPQPAPLTPSALPTWLQASNGGWGGAAASAASGSSGLHPSPASQQPLGGESAQSLQRWAAAQEQRLSRQRAEQNHWAHAAQQLLEVQCSGPGDAPPPHQWR